MLDLHMIMAVLAPVLAFAVPVLWLWRHGQWQPPRQDAAGFTHVCMPVSAHGRQIGCLVDQTVAKSGGLTADRLDTAGASRPPQLPRGACPPPHPAPQSPRPSAALPARVPRSHHQHHHLLPGPPLPPALPPCLGCPCLHVPVRHRPLIPAVPALLPPSCCIGCLLCCPIGAPQLDPSFPTVPAPGSAAACPA